MKSAVSSLKGSFFKSPFGSSKNTQPVINTNLDLLQVKEVSSAYEDAHSLMRDKLKKAAAQVTSEEEEDEKYDYGAECKEAYLKRERSNTHFEEIGFRKDAKNALVYTNEENLKK